MRRILLRKGGEGSKVAEGGTFPLVFWSSWRGAFFYKKNDSKGEEGL